MSHFNREKYARLRSRANSHFVLRREIRIIEDYHGKAFLSFHFKDGRPDKQGLMIPRFTAFSMLLLDQDPIIAINHNTDPLTNGVIWIEGGMINTSILVGLKTSEGPAQQPFMMSEPIESHHFAELLDHMKYKADVVGTSSALAFDRIMADLVKA